MAGRKPEDVLRILQEQALEDEMNEVAALSDEELDRELADAGLDPQAERAWGRAVAERAARAPDEVAADGGAAWASVVPIAPPKAPTPRWVLLLVAAAVLLVLGGGGAYVAAHWSRHEEELPPRVVPDTAPSATPAPPAPTPPPVAPRSSDRKGRTPETK